MIRIVKNREPQEWKRRRETPGAIYEATPELRKSLLEEQGYICAYCMQLIKEKGSKIEHIKCRERHDELKLNYNNMIICCSGKTKEESHCDDSKKAKNISIDLFSPVLEQHIKYNSKDGTIVSDIPKWSTDINDILCLNIGILKESRKQALDGIIEILRQKKWKTPFIEEKLEQWSNKDTNGHYKQYCGIVIWYLKKRIK